MAQTTNSSIKMQIRKAAEVYTCSDCGAVLWKAGITKNGRYQRYQCQGCKKQWVELQPARPAILRAYIRNYDEK